MYLPELAMVNILTRFPLKSVARFRLMSREWRSLIDSDFFRDRYISFNSSSSVSWSIIQMKPHKLSLEIVGHHGCETWGLDRSPGSFPSFFAETTITKILVLSCTDGLVLIYTEDFNKSPSYYIGSPLLQEWSRIPLPMPSIDLDLLRTRSIRFSDTGLVTKMENGVVVSYKIVWMLRSLESYDKLDFLIYSSGSGTWDTTKNLLCLHSTIWPGQEKSIALNGILHWLSAGSVVAYDFYGDGHGGDGEFRIVGFPGEDGEIRSFTRSFTTSEGSIVYLNEFHEMGNRTLRVWRMVKYTDDVPEAWELSWEINNMLSLIELGIDYFPVVMHPLKSEIIYLWSRSKKGMILFNLRTLVFTLHKEYECESKCMDGCILSFNGCSEYIDSIRKDYIPWYQGGIDDLFFSQYVLPRWFHSLPRPHQPT